MATPKRKTTKRATKATSRKRRTGSRELGQYKAGDFFARRTTGGRFREMDERGRSLSQDRRRKAKTTARSGQGDRGDRKR
jgi:hypothetical protein